jgi:hypothetical protein
MANRYESSGFGVLIGSSGTRQFGWKEPAASCEGGEIRL